MKPICQFSRRISESTDTLGVFLGSLDRCKCQRKVSVKKSVL